jgi:hypothetical protein
VPAGDLLRRLDSQLLPALARGALRLSAPGHHAELLAATATLCVTAVLGTAIWAADRPVVADRTVGEVVQVGVAAGESIPAYVRASRAELASLARAAPATETYALATLSEYVTPARLGSILRGVSVSEVMGRVPLPKTRTEIVRLSAERLPADAEAAMGAVADGKEREARDYRTRGSAVTGNDQSERELRRLYETGAAVARAEAAAFRGRCGCLYAAVVRSTPAALAEVTRRPGVRSVDPAPEVRRLERAVFLPPLPEQSDVVRPPIDASLPGGAPPPPSQPPVTTRDVSVAPNPPSQSAPTPAPMSASPSAVPTDPPGTPTSSPDASVGPSDSPMATPAATQSFVPTPTPTVTP